MLLAEQIMPLDKGYLDRKIEACTDGRTIGRIETAVREQVGME
jgi:hypothetical protein